MALDLRARAELPCALERAHRELEALDGYPSWLGIVTAVAPAPPDNADEGPAWWVELGGRVGLVRLGKRVRMVRLAPGPESGQPPAIVFERRELDGRSHNLWRLEAHLEQLAPALTAVEVAVIYGGSRMVPVADALLRREVGRAARRLKDRVRS